MPGQGWLPDLHGRQEIGGFASLISTFPQVKCLSWSQRELRAVALLVRLEAIVGQPGPPGSRLGTHGRPGGSEEGEQAMENGAGSPEDGRIPFTLRVGVTGHRLLEDPASLRPAIRQAIDRIKQLAGDIQDTSLVLVVVSALAEGADRLVAREVLAEADSRLEAALPLPTEEYLDDFERPESKQEFQELLGQASDCWTAPAGGSREEAYEQAGHYVVKRSDALIALWDGEPEKGRGGTAAIVGYARDRDVPLVWVKTKGDPVVAPELHTKRADVIELAALKLDEYNASLIKPLDLQSEVRKERDRLIPDATAGSDPDPLRQACEKAAGWLLPYYVRADAVAVRLQNHFRALSSAIFVLAAAAVSLVAVQVSFLPDLNWLALFEIILLVGLLAIWWLSRRWRLHERWISYRYLAERLRSSYFLALAGTGDRRDQPARLAYLSDPSEDWIQRSLEEVTALRPRIDTRALEVRSVRGYLNQHWIGSQVRYHEKTANRNSTWDERLTWVTALLFGITVIAALLHTLGVGKLDSHESEWAKLFIVLSISVPAIGAAVHGIGALRQFRRHSERYRRMVGLLAQLQLEMSQATSLEQVREVAAETERVMREENSDWFGVVRFHDMELIT